MHSGGFILPHDDRSQSCSPISLGALTLTLAWICCSTPILLYEAQVWADREGACTCSEAASARLHPASQPREPSPYSSGRPSTG